MHKQQHTWVSHLRPCQTAPALRSGGLCRHRARNGPQPLLVGEAGVQLAVRGPPAGCCSKVLLQSFIRHMKGLREERPPPRVAVPQVNHHVAKVVLVVPFRHLMIEWSNGQAW